jgi:acyl-CoA thioester hydrolase
MARYTFHCPMRWSDMDAYGHVNNVVFLTYLEEARVEMFYDLASQGAGRTDADREADPENGGLLASGVVVARSEIDYKKPLVHRYQPVPIDVWVSRIGGASFHLRYEVHDEGGVVYATAASTLVTYDFRAAAPRRITPHERAFLERYYEPDTQPAGRADAGRVSGR